MFFGALSEQLGFVLICQKDPAGGDECSLVKCEDSLTAPVSFINNSKKMSFRFYASSPFLSGRLPMRYAFSMTNLNDRKAIIKPPVIAMPRPRSISGPGISANLDANVKPLSEMPGSKRPWIFAVMSLVFAKEGMFKSFYRLHEDSIR